MYPGSLILPIYRLVEGNPCVINMTIAKSPITEIIQQT